MKQPTGYDSDLRSTSQAGKLPGGLLFCYMKIITIQFEHYPLGRDTNIEKRIQEHLKDNNLNQIIIPFSYDELTAKSFDKKTLEERFKSWLFDIDLFFSVLRQVIKDNFTLFANIFDGYSATDVIACLDALNRSRRCPAHSMVLISVTAVLIQLLFLERIGFATILDAVKWIVNSMSCRGLAKVIFSLMSWEDDGKYRFKGEFRSNGSDKLLLFELDEPVVSKTVEQVIVPEKDDEEQIMVQETVRVYPPSWGAGFGTPIVSIARGHLLSQQHYSGDWDVLRPARDTTPRIGSI